ncbi:host specificity protein J, partial [Escherichia coli NE1487]
AGRLWRHGAAHHL